MWNLKLKLLHLRDILIMLTQLHSIALEIFSQVDQGIDTIKLWNVESQTEIATLTGHSSSVNSVAFNSYWKYSRKWINR